MNFSSILSSVLSEIKSFLSELFGKRPNSGGTVRRKRQKTIFAIAAALILPVCIIYGYYFSKVNMLDFNTGVLEEEGVISDSDASVIAESNEMQEATEGLEETEVVIAEGEIIDSSDVFNVLLIGTDERTQKFSNNARGDSCMLLSINKKTMAVHLVSFERGMAMPILYGQYEGSYDWLTHLFRYGGADMMMKSISQSFKLDIDYYARVNFYTFEQVINAVGGVDVTLSELEAKGLNGEVETNATTRQRVHEGLNHLDGYDALQYSRIRYIDSDWHRIERQRKVMEAVIEKAMTLDIGQLNNMLDTVLPLVRTNLTEAEITSLLLLAPKLPNVTIEQMTIPVKGTYGSMTGLGGRAMFAPNYEQNAKILHDALYGTNETAEK